MGAIGAGAGAGAAGAGVADGVACACALGAGVVFVVAQAASATTAIPASISLDIVSPVIFGPDYGQAEKRSSMRLAPRAIAHKCRGSPSRFIHAEWN